MTVTNIIAIVLGSVGLLFMLISFFGVVSYPDFFTRLHAQGVGDTLGALLIFIAMIVATGFKLISVKIFLLFFVIMLTNPLGTNLIILAEMHSKDYQEYEKKEEEVLKAIEKKNSKKNKKEDKEEKEK